MKLERERQRLQELFKDLERLASDPASQNLRFRHDLEAVRARVLELEARIRESEKAAPARPAEPAAAPRPRAAKPQDTAPLLYERDQIGYGYRDDRLESLTVASPTAAGGQNALVAKFAAGERAEGQMVVEPADGEPFADDQVSLANTILQQAAVQIQNLRLLAATRRARAEAEDATRQFMHEGWGSYLDAIHRSERIGFSYDQASLTPFSDRVQPNGGVGQTVSVLDEQVGTLYLKPNPERPLTPEDRSLIGAVASQVAQQIENIRLQADAARARAEAEDAVARMTGEAWLKYAEADESAATGFVYDSKDIIPLNGNIDRKQIVLAQPLKVRGETIGQLAVAGGKALPPESAELAAAVAAQASIHLETLRLSAELQKRARQLEELDRLKSAFLANMSHELRTPLNSILGFADVMLEELDGPLTENMGNDLRLVQKNGQHLLHLINDVLDMAKIEAGRMNLNPERFNLQTVLEEVVSITSTLASERNLSLYIDPDSDPNVEIYADNTRIRQVMINLVNNAIKFTEKGGIDLRVKRTADSSVRITVKDTGMGISPKNLESIFQEFAQVDSSTTRKAGGTGLGLPISRRLVEMHGGRLWAESSGVEGEGACFYVELPIEARITEVVERLER
jgi:signal transduction histidine kinase